MKTELYFVRHGQTEWNRQRRLQGIMDSPLTREGLQQAGKVAGRLSGIHFDAIYSSDLGRAMETASIITSQLNSTPIVPDTRLRERNFGIFHGFNWEEIITRFPEEGRKEKEAQTDYVIPGGESRQQMLGRVVAFLDDISRLHPKGRVLAVSHGGVLSLLIRHVLQIPFNSPRRYFLPNAALNIFEFSDGKWFVKTLGEISFHETEDLSDGIQ